MEFIETHVTAHFSVNDRGICRVCLLQKSEVPADYDKHDPEQKQIYRFVRTLFSAAQLMAECAIVTLVRLTSSG